MATDPGRLGPAAREQVDRIDSVLLLSLGSVWEMAIKSSLGKLEVPGPLDAFLDEQLRATRTLLLDLQLEHVLHVERLPLHHRDPFDRVLAAQAIVEDLPVLSADPQLDAYPLRRIW
jgi:PIN domain nuclease of toxin-antitoxin system